MVQNHPTADFLTSMGYRRTSGRYRRVSRVDVKYWIMVLARSHFGDTNWAYIVGPDHYRRCHSNDHLEIDNVDIYRQIPSSDDRFCAYRELTDNNISRLNSLKSGGAIRVCT